jgi:hypothetical protein
MSNFTKLVGSVMAGMGTLFTVIGVVNGLNTRSFVATATPAQGTVIDLVRRSSTDSDGDVSYAYYPVVKFTPSSGQSTIFESNTGSNPPGFSKGQLVDILYNPQKPNSAMINSWFSLWGFPAIFTGIGSIFVVVGGVLIVKPPFKQQVQVDFDAHLTSENFGKDF